LKIHRQDKKDVWARVEDEHCKKLVEYCKASLSDTSWMTNSSNTSLIPFLGSVLHIFKRIDNDLPDETKDGLINFSKRLNLAAIIAKIKNWQRTKYEITPRPDIQACLSLPSSSHSPSSVQSSPRMTPPSSGSEREERSDSVSSSSGGEFVFEGEIGRELQALVSVMNKDGKWKTR